MNCPFPFYFVRVPWGLRADFIDEPSSTFGSCLGKVHSAHLDQNVTEVHYYHI